MSDAHPTSNFRARSDATGDPVAGRLSTTQNVESWRPGPDDSDSGRIGEWRRSVRDRIRARTAWQADTGSDAGGDREAITKPSLKEGSLIFSTLIAIGSAVLTVSAIFGWQEWAARSSDPIDDQLPFVELAEDAQGPTGVATAAPAATGPTTVAADDSSREGDQGGEVSAMPVPGDSLATEPRPDPTMVVHVSGEVLTPGVVRLNVGSRVYEAVEQAGGSTVSADLDRVNLAAPLIDGERIHVPTIGEELLPQVVLPDRSAIEPTSDPLFPATPVVDLNRATPIELQALPGVGPATAAAIVRTREERGPYFAIEDLLAVPGIGETRLEQLRPYVLLQDQPGR